VFAYETALRPATVEDLQWRDWNPEEGTLTIRDEVDKARFGRVLPLSPRAAAALHAALALSVDTADGDPIFGRHDARTPLLRAAKAAGIPSLADYDFRHARLTHLAEAGVALPAVAYIAGHKHLTTTDHYARATYRAAEDAMRGSVIPSRETSPENLRSRETDPQAPESLSQPFSRGAMRRESLSGSGGVTPVRVQVPSFAQISQYSRQVG
jgi:hypothetical protein